MNFNEIVLNKIKNKIKEEGFLLKEQFFNYLRFESRDIKVIICRDEKENSNLFYINKLNSIPILIDNVVIKEFVISDIENELIIPEVTIEDFANNLLVLFTKNNSSLLKLDDEFFTKIESFTSLRSKKYTEDLLQKQRLDAANKSWEIKNYKQFIDCIEMIGVDNLSESYRLKYKIAKNNNKNNFFK